jgi:hypothetical protein
VTGQDQQRVAEWIGDAFAILCVRQSGLSDAETNLRLGFEAILRQLRIPPLDVLVKSAPAPYRPVLATPADLRHILKALNSCIAIFERYDAVLTPTQGKTLRMVRDARRFAEQELEARRVQPAELVAV